MHKQHQKRSKILRKKKRMNKNKLLFVLLLWFVPLLQAQDIDYAREVIQTLCSPAYHGRGYVNEGDRKAAIFLIQELKDKKVAPLVKRQYKQPFRVSVNTFGGNMLVAFGQDTLHAGADYLLAASSNTTKGRYTVALLNNAVVMDKDRFTKFIQQDFSDKVLVVDSFGMNAKMRGVAKYILNNRSVHPPVFVELTKQNLMHIPAVHQEKYAYIKLKKEKFSESSSFVTIDIDSEFLNNYETQNVVAYVEGEEADSFVVFSAHYDHLGRMGRDVYFPGAHDNASGTSMVLDLARHYASQKNKPKYSLIFIFFSGEEIGLLGSFHFVRNPLVDLSKIKVVLNLDIVGSGDEGIQIVNSKVFPLDYEVLLKINAEHELLPAIKARGAAANSDHYPFHAAGVKSFFIYTLGSYKEYHNIYDQSDKVPLVAYENLFRLLTLYVEGL